MKAAYLPGSVTMRVKRRLALRPVKRESGPPRLLPDGERSISFRPAPVLDLHGVPGAFAYAFLPP